MEGVGAGEVDLSNYFPPGLALARQRGVEARIVSSGTLTPRGLAIMVKKDSPITELGQLAGKTVGITSNGSTTDFFALWAADQAGGDITRVPVGGGALIPSLISGNVEAISAYPPLSYKLELSGDGRILRSEEHTSELQSLMRISYAVFCLKKKKARFKKRPHNATRNQHYTNQTVPNIQPIRVKH